MKVVQAHKFFWHRDGASNYALYLAQLLRDAGHESIPFAMKEPKSLPTPYDSYFVQESNLDNPLRVSFSDKLRFVSRMFYSFDAKKQITRLLHDVEVDIVHLHNIYHHISPSILPVIRRRGIPIVMTLHDYKLICPNYTMFHHGRVHEEDARGWYMSCVRNKCMKDSRAQSALVAAEMIFHHKIMKYYERYVDKFIAPSKFILDKCVAHGWPRKKFVHIPHPIDEIPSRVSSTSGTYVAYVGRLSEEKGLFVLLEAAKKTPHIPYTIIGDGPLRSYIDTYIATHALSNVVCTGFQTGEALARSIRDARILVLPSIWYENYPLSILEAHTRGTIVLGSDIGGIPELLPRDHVFPAHDSNALSRRIEKWFSMPAKDRSVVGRSLARRVRIHNDPAKHIEHMLDLYTSLCS